MGNRRIRCTGAVGCLSSQQLSHPLHQSLQRLGVPLLGVLTGHIEAAGTELIRCPSSARLDPKRFKPSGAWWAILMPQHTLRTQGSAPSQPSLGQGLGFLSTVRTARATSPLPGAPSAAAHTGIVTPCT